MDDAWLEEVMTEAYEEHRKWLRENEEPTETTTGEVIDHDEKKNN